MKAKFLMGAATVCTMALGSAATAGTLEDVKERGHLLCGTSEGVAGFSAPNDEGVWVGFDVDACRAVAAAIFGDPNKIEFISLNSKDRFTALQSGEVDLLPRSTTFTLTRDASLGLDFAAINYYDGQGIMVRADLGLTKASELDGVTVCLRTGSTTELNLADYFSANNMSFQSVVFDKSDEIRKAYEAGRCDVMSGDRSQLAVRRSQLPDPSAHIVLDEVISKEPLAVAVRQGDDAWGDVVRWSFNVMVLAEESGITQANVDEVLATTNTPAVKRLLGSEGEFGAYLGLPADWGYQVVKHVGNYGESFERNLGKETAIGLDRGLNALWSDGGVMYVPPAN
ncbi:amino acid ABC transporter substrate-binding protein [Sulfitobacter sp. F26204]|uniref:amino acid ABC transporter substrate-binding protein n=1 Tax=Sulfitobacter sp. F26204 TaxID=2996014 RepID=UPI00225DDE25|nr:amino acid ABC transporter substrate-binding protein [Sulfitobacter sp. F26204]